MVRLTVHEWHGMNVRPDGPPPWIFRAVHGRPHDLAAARAYGVVQTCMTRGVLVWPTVRTLYTTGAAPVLPAGLYRAEARGERVFVRTQVSVQPTKVGCSTDRISRPHCRSSHAPILNVKMKEEVYWHRHSPDGVGWACLTCDGPVWSALWTCTWLESVTGVGPVQLRCRFASSSARNTRGGCCKDADLATFRSRRQDVSPSRSPARLATTTVDAGVQHVQNPAQASAGRVVACGQDTASHYPDLASPSGQVPTEHEEGQHEMGNGNHAGGLQALLPDG